MIDDRTGSSKLALCLFCGRLCITDNSHYMQMFVVEMLEKIVVFRLITIG